MEVFKRYGVELPDFVENAFAFRAIDTLMGEAVISRSWEEVYRPQDKDVPLVVLMRIHPHLITHAGVFLGDGRVIHTKADVNAVLSKVSTLGNCIVGYYRPCSQS